MFYIKNIIPSNFTIFLAIFEGHKLIFLLFCELGH